MSHPLEPEEGSLHATMVAAGQGNPEAIEAVFRTLLPMLQRLARQPFGLSYQERDDLIGQVSAWLAEGLPSLCQDFNPALGAARPWFQVILKRKVLRFLRSRGTQKRRLEVLYDQPPEQQEAYALDLEVKIDGRNLHTTILEWVGKRDALDQTIFHERITGGQTSGVVGEALGLSVAAVDKRVGRMKSGLAEYLQRRGLLVLFWATLFLALLDRM